MGAFGCSAAGRIDAVGRQSEGSVRRTGYSGVTHQSFLGSSLFFVCTCRVRTPDHQKKKKKKKKQLALYVRRLDFQPLLFPFLRCFGVLTCAAWRGV